MEPSRPGQGMTRGRARPRGRTSAYKELEGEHAAGQVSPAQPEAPGESSSQAPPPQQASSSQAPPPQQEPSAQAPPPEQKPSAQAAPPQQKPSVQAPPPQQEPSAKAPQSESISRVSSPESSAGAASLQPTSTVPPEAEASRAIENLKIAEEAPPTTQSRLSKYTYNVTRPTNLVSKLGNYERPVALVTNYFEAKIDEKWSIHQYAVSFNPPFEDDQSVQRKGVLRTIGTQLPPYIFDGLMLFTVGEISRYPMVIMTADKFTNAPIQITIDSHKEVQRDEPVCLQIYNIFIRTCLAHCKFVQMGRRYFDPSQKIELKQYNLEIWPGFSTALRLYEHSLLLNVEMVSKIVRTNSVLDIIYELRRNSRSDNEDEIRKHVAAELEGRIVMTVYNNSTYPIKSVVWDQTPSSTFQNKDGSERTYLNYYESKYGLKIRNDNQPLLLTAPKEKDIRRGFARDIILVPETCVLTGLSGSMRSNFNLMSEIGKHIFAVPEKRVNTLESFIKRFSKNHEIQKEMDKWQIHFDSQKLLRLQGHMLAQEKIKAGQKIYSSQEFSKGSVMRDKLHDPQGMAKWLAIVPQRDMQDFNKFLDDFARVSRPMNFKGGRPEIGPIADTRSATYLDKIDKMISDMKGKVNLIFVVLPNNRADLYSVVKQKLTRGLAIPSQFCLSKNLKKGLSVASKIAVQMSCKIGGVPWIIRNTFKERVCVMGFDVFHSGGMGGVSVGAIVATTNHDLSKSCSFVTRHKHREEISKCMGKQVLKCLSEYYRMNNSLPERIMFYRDGVGEGQVDIVIEQETNQVVDEIKSLYLNERKLDALPKITYVIVTKRINTRFMTESGGNRFGNPEPGTCVDDHVTLKFRYDFFIVSQIARQGTVSPTNYNVIYDTAELAPQELQQFTFRLCHNYYNWTGTISVPSVCQNAHKLAYITGEAIKGPCPEGLRHLPYYL